MEWMLMPLRRYADFTGRSRRKEFWMFFLFQMLVFVASAMLFIMYFWTGFGDDSSALSVQEGFSFLIIPIFWLLFWLATIIPNMAVIVRRFHDLNLPGWVGVLLYVATMLLSFPGLVILIFMAMEGKKGDNQYGKDPKMNQNVGEVFK